MVLQHVVGTWRSARSSVGRASSQECPTTAPLHASKTTTWSSVARPPFLLPPPPSHPIHLSIPSTLFTLSTDNGKWGMRTSERPCARGPHHAPFQTGPPVVGIRLFVEYTIGTITLAAISLYLTLQAKANSTGAGIHCPDCDANGTLIYDHCKNHPRWYVTPPPWVPACLEGL